jgi:hypothetical protein
MSDKVRAWSETVKIPTYKIGIPEGLGYLGLGDLPAAKEHLEIVPALDANHLGATLHLRLVK